LANKIITNGVSCHVVYRIYKAVLCFKPHYGFATHTRIYDLHRRKKDFGPFWSDLRKNESLSTALCGDVLRQILFQSGQ